MNTQQMTTSRERWSYGGFSFGQNLMYMVQLQFLTYFYTEEVGLTLGATATLLLVAKLWDAVNDPIMGAIADKLQFRGGKFIPWLKFTSIIIPLTMLFTFIHIDSSTDTMKLVFAYMTYILWGMAYTVSDSPMFSLSTVMTSQTYERDKLIAIARMSGAIAAIATATFMLLVNGIGWLGAIAIYCLASLITMLPLPYVAKERVKYEPPTISFLQIFKQLLRNKYFFIFYSGYLLMSATNTLQTIAAYFANSNLGDEGLLTVLLAVLVLPIVIVSPLLPKLINKFGKKKLTIYSCILTIILSIIQYVVGYDNFILFLMIAAIRVLCMQIPLLLYGMFTADCIEYGNAVTGSRTTAVTFSVQTMFTKIAGALSSTICLTLLSYYGYVEQGATQSAEAIHGIWIIFTLVPIVGYIAMIVAMIFYKLDEATVAGYMKQNQTGMTISQ